jgi:hypothetical protein
MTVIRIAPNAPRVCPNKPEIIVESNGKHIINKYISVKKINN